MGLDFDIVQVAELLGLERKNGESTRTRTFNVRCPICGDFKLNIHAEKGVWRCAHCGESGGTLSLYTRFGYGEPIYTKELGRKAAQDISKQLGMGISAQDNIHRQVADYIDDNTTLSDDELHNVYSKLISIPALRLLSDHANNLKRRGFSDSAVKECQYRSLPGRLNFPKGKRATLDEFKAEKLDELYKSKPELKRLSRKNIISGLYIGTYMTNVFKVRLDNVPGFFKIKNYWCFNYRPGMLIPIRNIDNKIVGFQIYTGVKGYKYITLSSRGFDSGTSGGARAHYCTLSHKLDAKTEVYVTEGPLKADCAMSLSGNKNVAYIAILGVSATNDLSNMLKKLSEKGCKKVTNALDMDKLTNINVLKACKKISETIRNSGMEVGRLFWDDKTAFKILNTQEKLMEEHNLDLLPYEGKTGNLFVRIAKYTQILNSNKIDFPKAWAEDSKGIDDYLRERSKSS